MRGITVYRWRGGSWLHVSHNRDSGGHHIKTTKTAAELGGPGKREDDWLVVDTERGSGAVYIPDEIVPETATLWYKSGGSWHSIYVRSSGRNDKPVGIDEIEAREGDVVIEVVHEDFGFYFIRGGEEPEVVVDEYVAVVDDFADPLVGATSNPIFAGDDDEEGSWGSIDEEEENPRQASILLQGASIVDNLGGSRRNYVAEIAAAERETDEPTRFRKMLSIIDDILVEATPSPTPGTTAVFDLPVLANEYSAAARGFDDKGTFTDEDGVKDETPGFMEGSQGLLNAASSVLATIGSSLDYLHQLRTIVNSIDRTGTATGERQADGTANTAAATAMVDSPKIVSSLFSSVHGVTQLVDSSSSFAASTSSVAQGMPFVGTAVSLITCARSVRKAHRARKRYSQFKKMLNTTQYTSEDMKQILKFAVGKTFRKTATSSTMAGTAVVGGTGGTILGTTAIIGGANAWNPAGWMLLGVAAVGGLGLVGYKVYRRKTRKKRHEKRVAKGRPVDACDMAKKLIAIAVSTSPRHPDAALATLMLESFGVKLSDLGAAGAQEAAIAMVDRHLKHQ